jgi:hypothetical protein
MTLVTPSVPATTTPVVNQTGQNVSVTITGGTVQSVLTLYGTNPVPVVATPAVAATTVPVTNANSFPVAVTVAANGATISAISVNGTGQGTSTTTIYFVPAGGTITLAYTVATPTWSWAPAVAGVSGNPVSSPFSVPLPANCSIELVFSGAPTWAWTNPIDEGYTPGFGPGSNTLAETTGYDPTVILPYAKHAALAQTGLAVGVAN